MICRRRIRANCVDSLHRWRLEGRALLSNLPVPVGAIGQPALVSGDLNGDGKADLVTATDVILPGTKTPVGQLSIQFGNGDGTFGAAETITLNGPVSAITTDDLTRTGHADIVCLGSSAGGGGALGQSMAYVIDVTNPQNDLTIGLPSAFPTAHVAVADMNGDGALDIVGWNDAVVGVEFGAVSNRIWHGTQPAFVKNPFGAGELQNFGDLNGDGIADAVLNVNGQLEIANGNGNGTFQPPIALADLPVVSGPVVPGIDLSSFSWGATNTSSASSSGISADRESSAPSVSEITASNTTAGVTVGFNDSNEAVSVTITKEIDRASAVVVTKSTDQSSPGFYRASVVPGPSGGLVITFTDGSGGQASIAVKKQGHPEPPSAAAAHISSQGNGVDVNFTDSTGQTESVLFQAQSTGVSIGLSENGTQTLQFLVQGAGTNAARIALNVNDGVDTGTGAIDFANAATTNDTVPGVQIQEQLVGSGFGTVEVTLGDPAAQFGVIAPPSATGPIWTSQFAIGDVNGDGTPDLVYLGTQVAEIFYGVPVSSTGTAITPDREGSTPIVSEIVIAPPGTIATFIGDVNGDGSTDIFGVDAQKHVDVHIRTRGVATVSE